HQATARRQMKLAFLRTHLENRLLRKGASIWFAPRQSAERKMRNHRGRERKILSCCLATFILAAHFGTVASVLSAQPGAARPASDDPPRDQRITNLQAITTTGAKPAGQSDPGSTSTSKAWS